MEWIKKYSIAAINLLAVLALVSCGDDDTPDPTPMVDCNTTGPSVALTVTDLSGCGLDDGVIALAITGGTGTNTVTVDPTIANFDAGTATFSGVEPGDYTVTITDSDNCTTSEDATVGFPAAALSFATDIKPIVEANCAVPTCHDGGGSLPDFNDFGTFQTRANNNAGGVRQRVKSGDMPRGGGSLTATEISNILCWIDEGAQNN